MPSLAGSQENQSSETSGVPVAEQEAWTLTPSQAATSHYASSMADFDDAQTRVSSYTYSSQNDAQRFLRHVDNRAFNALSDTYFLPTDEEEWNRLDKQHVALVLGLGGLVPDPEMVRAILSPEEGVTKKVLDLGCGTAVWCNEIGRTYPHTSVVGVDLAPTPVDIDSISSNVRFEIDDINLGLSHFMGQFDVVHARLIGSGLQSFMKTMREVEYCLKPGGVTIWLDGDYDLYTQKDGQFKYLPFATDDNPSGSWFQRFSYEVLKAGVTTGRSDLVGMAHGLDEGFWNSPLMDPETCRTASLYVPLGPWPTAKDVNQAQQMKYVGALMRQDVMNLHRATHRVLKVLGWPEEMLNEWSDKADKELMENTHSIWWRVRIAWGRRREGPGKPAPPLPTNTSTEPGFEGLLPVKWPYFYVYETREQAQRAAALRNADKNIASPPGPPTPLPKETQSESSEDDEEEEEEYED